MPRAVVIFNDRGQIVLSDSCANEAFGYDAEEALSMTIDNIIPALKGQIGRVVPYRSAGISLSGIKKQGTQFPVYVNLSHFPCGDRLYTAALIDFANEIKGTGDSEVENLNYELQQQIYKRRAIVERLVKIQHMYDAVVHNFPDGVIGVLNKEMKYVLIDGKDLDSIDLPSMGLTGKKPVEPQDPGLAGKTMSFLKRAFNGEEVSFEIETRDRVYNIIAVPLSDSLNRISEILCVVQNVTQAKRMEEGLRSALEKEIELGDLKSRFMTMASHEFRTPLSNILSSTYLLENYNGAEYAREKNVHTNRIKRAVNNLTMILNDFLSLENFEGSKVVLTDINIPPFIKDIIFEIELEKKNGQTIEYQHTGEQLEISLDHKLLWSIITNLISNAIKYSKANSVILVNSEIKDDTLIFSVKDSGIGIPEDEHKHIFDQFFRARNATYFDGRGIGLHIVQKYVHRLKGTITFESQAEVGTTFIVNLPDGAVINRGLLI